MSSLSNAGRLCLYCGRALCIAFILFLNLLICSQAMQKPVQYNKPKFEADIRRVYQNGDPDAVDSITRHGNVTLPWLMEKLADQRPMESGLQVRNSKSSFEEFAMYHPSTLSDAVRTILTRLTAFMDMLPDAPRTAKERAKGIQEWRTWYRRHKPDLKWIPAYTTYDWRGRDAFEKKLRK